MFQVANVHQCGSRFEYDVLFTFEILTYSTLVVFVTCRALCPLQFLMLELYWHKNMYNLKCCNDEILDLQRDLHANNFAPCEECTFGTPTLLFASLLWFRVPLTAYV